MTFGWLKNYMPRSLYGRATLILLLPVITLLLVVSVVSVQRVFEGVTKQMTTSASREVRLLLDSPSPAHLADVLQVEIEDLAPEAVPQQDQRRWYDFTGRVVIRELYTLLPELRAVALPDNKHVGLYFDTPRGPVVMRFDRRRMSASNPHQLIVNMLFFGGVMTLIASLYLRGQLRPITRLSRAAEAFGRGQSVEYRPAGANEVRAAGHAFINMRARIERQIEQRTLMLSGVSHDLRTPLTRLRLSLAMLDTSEDEIEPMLRDLRDMERLLDEFLDFARGAASDGAPQPVDPVALIHQIVADCTRANIPATLHEVDGSGMVALRAGGIRRAVQNLVNNAVSYGTRAEISVRVTDKMLRIRVEDDGPGIAEHQRADAVKPFARLDPGRNQDRGTRVGLGLAITTDIVRAHGGHLRLGHSERLGGLCADLVITR
ncbi:ATP-binding protein [Roseovarius aestuarii]|nr:ATP-binding protein [Roseovarius aestuarii]